MSGDLDIIKSGLINRIESVCERLLPDGKPEGGLWVAWNPVEHDQKPYRAPALTLAEVRAELEREARHPATIGDIARELGALL